MKKYTLVNGYTGEEVIIKANVLEVCKAYLYRFYLYQKDKPVETAIFATRNWDIRDIENLDK